MIRDKVQVHLWRENEAGGRLYAVFHRCAAKGDYWQPITGNVETGEKVDACALREVGEEAGVHARPEDLTPCLWVCDWSRGGVSFAEHVFGLRCSDDGIVLSSEHRAVEWLPYAGALARFAFEGNRRGLAWVENWLNENS